MAKRAGRNPAKNSKLPDPKIWKKCKHEGCLNDAIFLEDYCWNHLPAKSKTRYKSKIALANSSGRYSFHGINLEKADLRAIDLSANSFAEANLKWVDLRDSDLQASVFNKASLEHALLSGVNLQNAHMGSTCLNYASLKEARLFGTRLKHSILYRTNLEGADLTNAQLQGSLLFESKLNRATLTGAQFEGAHLHSVDWGDAQDLHWNQIKMCGEEKYRWWSGAREAYRRLKNYFHRQGKYDEEGEAYYREKLMTQCEAWKNRKFGRWLWLFILNILAGYGEKVGRTVIGAIAVIFGFGLLYFLGSIGGWCVLNQIRPDLLGKFLDSIYFSVLAFSTFGFGTIAPACGLAKLFIVIEIILGYVFLGTLVTLIARKMGR